MFLGLASPCDSEEGTRSPLPCESGEFVNRTYYKCGWMVRVVEILINNRDGYEVMQAASVVRAEKLKGGWGHSDSIM